MSPAGAIRTHASTAKNLPASPFAYCAHAQSASRSAPLAVARFAPITSTRSVTDACTVLIVEAVVITSPTIVKRNTTLTMRCNRETGLFTDTGSDAGNAASLGKNRTPDGVLLYCGSVQRPQGSLRASRRIQHSRHVPHRILD